MPVSFETPEYTANADALGTLRLLEAIRILGIEDKTRFYQASTSELYGKVQESPQRETTPFYPRSPYAVAKLYAYWITVNYREAYGMHASNGILFNHEGPMRGETFVTRKITRAVAAIERGLQDRLYLGNLNARARLGSCARFRRGHVADAAAAEPGGLCSGHRGDAFGSRIRRARICLRRPQHRMAWQGRRGGRLDAKTGKDIVRIDPRYFRPTEVDELLGDASKARAQLGWKPKVTFAELVAEMVESDRTAVEQETARNDRSAL